MEASCVVLGYLGGGALGENPSSLPSKDTMVPELLYQLPESLALPDSCWSHTRLQDLEPAVFVSWVLEQPSRNLACGGGEQSSAKEHFYFTVLNQLFPGHWACGSVILSQPLPISCKCAIKGNLATTTVKCPQRVLVSWLTAVWGIGVIWHLRIV